MRSLTWRAVWARRLARHGLLASAPANDLGRVVRDVCGIHAQVMTSAELSLGLRVDGLRQQDVRAALWEHRTLVKTYGPRGTVHLFASDDLPTWIAALQAVPPSRPLTQFELDVLSPAQTEQVIEAMREALDGRCLSRDELAAELVQRVGSWVADKVWPAFGGMWPRWQLALSRAAQSGVLLFGPNQGTRVTYVRADQWLSNLPAIDGSIALQTVLLRYLQTYGPATPAEFARWINTPVSATRSLFESAEAEIEAVDVEGWRAWLPRDHVTETDEPSPSVHLLPRFDCYVVGCHPREQLIPSSAPAALQKGTAAPYAVVLIDGIVGGLWSHERRGKTLSVTVGAFEPMSKPQERLAEEQAVRIAAVLGLQPSVTFAPVAPRWHM